jgi:hypothetical protein
MHDGINCARLKQVIKASAIRQISDDEFHPRRHSLAMAATEVIKGYYLMPGLQQLVGHHASDVARSPGD